jgi:hypothetical protein
MVRGYGNGVQVLVIDLRVSIFLIKNVDMVYLLGQLVIFIRGIMIRMLEMVMGRCIGMMVVIIRVTGRKGSNMVKVLFMYLVKD